MTGLPTVHVKHHESCKTESQTHPTSSKPHLRRVLGLAVGVVIGVLVLSAVILSAVYFGYHLTLESYKEGKITVHDASGETLVENVIIRNEEVEIRSPGRFTVINDYNKFLSVYKVDWEGGARCYVSHLNLSVSGTPRDMENRIQEGEQFVDESTPVVEYVGTRRQVDPSQLSASAKALCTGSSIEWLATTPNEISELHFRSKRCSGDDKGKGKKKKTEMTIKVTIKIKVEVTCKVN